MFDWGIGQLSTKSLIDELKRRFDAIVLMGVSDANEGEVRHAVSGDYFRVLGLTSELQHLIQTTEEDGGCKGK